MGSQQSVLVANAFPQDIYVRVRSERITSDEEATNSSGQVGPGTSLKLPLQGSFSLQAKIEKRTTYEVLIEAGFQRMPKGGLSTLKPPSNRTKTVYLTVLYYDSEGNERKIAEDVPYGESLSVIVTGTGGIVDAKDRRYPWIDLNGVDHRQNPCEVCSEISSICTFCMLDSRMKQVQVSIGVVHGCQLAKSLVGAAEKIKGNSDINTERKEVNEMIMEIESLARSYWTLESKTKEAVSNVKVYGCTSKESAEDYLEDGILSEFWKELSNIQEVSKGLQEMCNEHEKTKGEAFKLQRSAQRRSETFDEKAQAAMEVLHDGKIPTLSLVSTPVLGQVLTGAAGGWGLGEMAVEYCEKKDTNMLVKVAAGAGAGLAGAAAGVAFSLVTIPAGPYFWWKSIESYKDEKTYPILAEEFGSIAVQMGLVEEHLTKITKSLHDIKFSLSVCQDTERRAIEALTKKKRKKMIKRVLNRANELIESCDKYFSIVNAPGMDRALGI